MIRVYVATFGIMLALWLAFDKHQEDVFERYAVLVAVTAAFITYVILVIAYWKARKTKLNEAMAINKFYWALLLAVLILPVLWGAVLRDAPYVEIPNPYSLWSPPAWLRTYIWLALTISIVKVLFEFYWANWGAIHRPKLRLK